MLFTAIIIFLSVIGCKKSAENTSQSCTATVQAVDMETMTPFSAVKVSINNLTTNPPFNTFYATGIDSGFTDAAGKIYLHYTQLGLVTVLIATKPPYLSKYPFISTYSCFNNIPDSIYLFKPSNLNLAIHRANSYLATDTIHVQIKGNFWQFYDDSYFRSIYKTNANSADTLFGISSFYKTPGDTKVYFQWDIIRNGSILSTQTDSTDLIQYGTKNYDLNY